MEDIGLGDGGSFHLKALQEQSKVLTGKQTRWLKLTERKRKLREMIGEAATPEPSVDWRIGTVEELLRSKHTAATSSFKHMPIDSSSLNHLPIDARANTEHRKILDLLLAHRLSGISVFRTQAVFKKDRNVGFRFDTSFRGVYYERYYIILKPDSLYRHSIPHFIPVEKLFKNNSLKDFLRVVQSYLNAFVSRREHGLSAAKYHEAEFSGNAAYDVITFSNIKPDACIRLEYKSLLDTVPCKVSLDGPLLTAPTEVKLTESHTGLDLNLLDILNDCKELL